jgi:hypothetical protein
LETLQAFAKLWRRYQITLFTWKLGFYDFAALLENKIQKIPNISSAFLFKFTQDGILTKCDDFTEEYSKWRSDSKIEPFKCFTGSLDEKSSPPTLATPTLPQPLKDKISSVLSTVPVGSELFWKSLSGGGVGTIQASVTKPTEFAFKPLLHQSSVAFDAGLIPETQQKIVKFGKFLWSEERGDGAWVLENVL